MREDTDRIGEILDRLERLSEAVQTLIRLHMEKSGPEEKSFKNLPTKVFSAIVPEGVEIRGGDLSTSLTHCETMWEIKTSNASLSIGEGTSLVIESRGIVEVSNIFVGQKIAVVHEDFEFSFWKYVEVLEIFKKEGGPAKLIRSSSPNFVWAGSEKWVLPVGPVGHDQLFPSKFGEENRADGEDEIRSLVESVGFTVKAVSDPIILDGSTTKEYVIERKR